MFKSSAHLKQTISFWLASNDFATIAQDMLLARERLTLNIGPAVYAQALATYTADNDTTDPLVEHIRLPLALFAYLSYSANRDVSHEDRGRKLSLSKDEKIPFEWMLERDERALENKAFAAVDRLIAYLDASTIEAWHTSAFKLASRKLLVSTTAIFDSMYPINASGRFYYTILPYINDAERNRIRPVLGAEAYSTLKMQYANADPAIDTDLVEMCQRATVYFAMATAVARLPLSVIPEGVVRQFSSQSGTTRASRAAEQTEIDRLVAELKADGEQTLTDIHTHINPVPVATDTVGGMKLNDPTDKFFQV